MTLAEVAAQLAKIEKTCPRQFRSFTHTYLIITKNIDAKLGTGFFEDDGAVVDLDVRFFELYEQAFQHPHLAWRLLNPVFGDLINLWLGANAHINYDLPRALSQSKISKTDYEQIVQILEDSIPQILSDLFPELPKEPAMRITKQTIRRWRARAWRRAQAIVE